MKTLLSVFTLLVTAWAAFGQGGTPPGGTPPGGTPPGGTTTSVTYYATYKLDGGMASQTNQSYTATATDTSGVWVTNSGALTLVNPAITTSGNTSSTDNSSFLGLNAGLLATAGGQVTVTGGTITTTGTGANGAFATGTGSSVTLSNTTINATGDGKTAYLNYVSPTQLNVQAPDDTATGNVTVAVTNSSGTATATAAMQAVMPGLFTVSNYVMAERASDGAIINGTDAVAAAKPGDVLEIFGTGLGATTPSVASGLVFTGAYATNSTPTVTIGGTAATVMYCGLIGAGLYQINLTVPSSLAAGTYPVVVTQGGAISPPTAVMKIASN